MMPKNAGVGVDKSQGSRSRPPKRVVKGKKNPRNKKRGQRTADPREKRRPRIARRDAARDVLDREQRDEAGLEAEPDAARERVERGHGLEDRDERGEYDERGDQHVHHHRRRGRVGPLEQVVQPPAPRRRDDGRRRPSRRAAVTAMMTKMTVRRFFVSAVVRCFLVLLFVVVVVGCATAYRGLPCDIVLCISGGEE